MGAAFIGVSSASLSLNKMQRIPIFFDVIYRVSINNIPMGFIQESYAKDADGDVAIENYSSLMIPVDQSSVSRTDSLSISYSSPEGSLINAYEYTIENGVMASEFNLGYQDGQWHIADAAMYQSPARQHFYLPTAALENEGPGYALSMARATALMPIKFANLKNAVTEV